MDSETIFSKKVTIEVYGLGYVGLPLAVKLSSSGFSVIGIDKDTNKVKRLSAGNLLNSEEFLRNDFEISKNLNKLLIQDIPNKSKNQKIGIICVPTPIPGNNISSDKFVKEATKSFLNNAHSTTSFPLYSGSFPM